MGSPLEIEPELGKKWSWGGKGRGQKGRGGALGSHCGSGSLSGLPTGALVMAGCVSVSCQWEGKEVGDRGLGEGP